MNKKEIVDILNSKETNELFKKADLVRKNNVGDMVHLRALVEFSNICKCNCKYCGLRLDNKNIIRYKMTKQDIINQAKLIASLGYKTIVLQSGENDIFSIDEMTEIISEIKKLNVALTLSIGEKSYEEYKEYKIAGADRYLLRIETTNEKLYEKLHPNASFKNRLRCLNDLQNLGFETGSGIIIGLPFQTNEMIADDILFFIKNDFDMIGIGPFIAHYDTPLKNVENGSFILTLKSIAITRINMPTINIPSTSAIETLKKGARLLALKVGANVVMPNFTPEIYQKKYEIYPNKALEKENLKNEIQSIQRFISKDFGNRKR